MLRVLPALDRRIPPWQYADLKTRACPFCRSRGTPLLKRPDGLVVRRCTRCDARFVSPAPAEHALEEFYRRYYPSHRRRELALYRQDRFLIREMHALTPQSDLKTRVLSSLLDLHEKRVLDVGFGMGQMMLLLRKAGADVHGIDLDPAAVAFAREKLHLRNVELCDIASLPHHECFDLITLHDIVEHPIHPIALLRHARALLAPGGLLSIWTPNASSPPGENGPVFYRVDLEHMQYITPRTCAYIARRLQLDIVHLETTGHPDLAKIAWLSGEPSRRRLVRQSIRRGIGLLPGAPTLNALRRRFTAPPVRRGSYHLFCVFRDHR